VRHVSRRDENYRSVNRYVHLSNGVVFQYKQQIHTSSVYLIIN
jgi:hypothetical protein